MVVIKDFDPEALKRQDFTRNADRHFTLAEYYKIAEKCISRFAEYSVAQDMLSDEDAVAYMVSDLILGTCRWTPDGGRDFKSYLNQCAIWSILKWLSSRTAVRKLASLDATNESGGSLYGELSSNEKTPYEHLAEQEHDILDFALNKCDLSPRQKQCFQMRFVDGHTLQEIADSIGVTREAVRLFIGQAINKVKTQIRWCQSESA